MANLLLEDTQEILKRGKRFFRPSVIFSVELADYLMVPGHIRYWMLPTP